jgi:hypothetical protein
VNSGNPQRMSVNRLLPLEQAGSVIEYRLA